MCMFRNKFWLDAQTVLNWVNSRIYCTIVCIFNTIFLCVLPFLLQDLYSCLLYLHETEYSSPDKTAVLGKSSGAMTIGNLCNRWPQLVQAAVLEVCIISKIK